MAKIFLISIPISEGRTDTIPQNSIDEIHTIKTFIVERARTARRFLKSIKHPIAIDDMCILEMDKNNKSNLVTEYKDLLEQDISIGIMSESGTPCIADPGNLYVKEAHALDMQITPLVGPSSILLALMASGLHGQQFEFHGYLPIKEDALKNKLRQISNALAKSPKTHICIETPYRNQRLFDNLIKHLSGEVQLCIAIDITSPNQSIMTKPIKQWKKMNYTIGKENAVFLIGT